MAVLTSRNPLFAYVCNMSHIVEPKLCILLSLVWQEIQEVAVVYLLKYVLVSGRSYDEITLARMKKKVPKATPSICTKSSLSNQLLASSVSISR